MAQVGELPALDREELLRRVETYVRENLLDGDDEFELTRDTPLLEWGVLNSMNTMRLLTFARDDLGIAVSPSHITGSHFRDLNSIADLFHTLLADARS